MIPYRINKSVQFKLILKTKISARKFKVLEISSKVKEFQIVRENSNFLNYFSVANTTDSLAASGLGSHRNWLQGLDSPLIQPNEEDSGQKELKLRFDVSQYSPEEIIVKTVDNKLQVNEMLPFENIRALTKNLGFD